MTASANPVLSAVRPLPGSGPPQDKLFFDLVAADLTMMIMMTSLTGPSFARQGWRLAVVVSDSCCSSTSTQDTVEGTCCPFPSFPSLPCRRIHNKGATPKCQLLPAKCCAALLLNRSTSISSQKSSRGSGSSQSRPVSLARDFLSFPSFLLLFLFLHLKPPNSRRIASFVLCYCIQLASQSPPIH